MNLKWCETWNILTMAAHQAIKYDFHKKFHFICLKMVKIINFVKHLRPCSEEYSKLKFPTPILKIYAWRLGGALTHQAIVSIRS